MKQDSYVTSSPASPPTVARVSDDTQSQGGAEMLEALKKLRQHIVYDHRQTNLYLSEYSEMLEEVDAVIAKAEGRS